jgi:glucoamylase
LPGISRTRWRPSPERRAFEQVWDGADIAERELYVGHPSGSAMPFVWAHDEYLKLCRSLFDGRIFDQPPQTVERYLVQQTTSDRIM